MPDRIFGLDGTRASIAAKSCIAIIIGYALALTFEWKASSLSTTIVILQTGALGSTLHKASLRVVGTLAGAGVGVVLVAVCAHDRELFFVSMALVTGVCVWAMQGSSNQYAWMLTLVTTAVVGWPAANDPLNTFPITVDRVIAVVVGVILASLVHGVLWPITGGQQFENATRKLLEGCRAYLSDVQQKLVNPKFDWLGSEKNSANLLNQASSLDGILDTARQDTKKVRQYFDQYSQLSSQLRDLVFSTIAVREALVQCMQTGVSSASRPNESLDNAFDSARAALTATVSRLSLLRDDPVSTLTIEPSEHQALNATRIEDGNRRQEADPLAELLISNISHVTNVANSAKATLSGLQVPRNCNSTLKRVSPARPDKVQRLKKAALAFCQVLFSTWVFVLFDWPAGLEAGMLLVMVVAFLNAQLPIALPISTFAKGVVGALPLAVIFYFCVMPSTNSFVELAPWLALMFFPFLYMVASPSPLTSMAAILAILLANSLISISGTPPSYDLETFATMYLGLCGGFGVALLLAYMLETRNPRRGLHQLMVSVLKKSADCLEMMESPAPTNSSTEAPAAADPRQLLQLTNKMRMLCVLIDNGQVLYSPSAQIQPAIRAVDVLVLRLVGSQASQSRLTAQNENERRVQAGCIATLRNTANELGEFRHSTNDPPVVPASDDRIADGAPDEVEAVRSAFQRSLIDAVMKCQTELAAINWRQWCANYF